MSLPDSEMSVFLRWKDFKMNIQGTLLHDLEDREVCAHSP